MPTYVVLLRAVNVGGTGKLPMATSASCLRSWASPKSKPTSTAAMRSSTLRAPPPLWPVPWLRH